jgi:hypothetical protein
VVGTRDELVKAGVLVEEGARRLVVVGSRPVAIARSLDPSDFNRIDRSRERDIDLPPGEYELFTRQDMTFASAAATREKRVSGSLHIEDPDRFWAPSRFLVLVRR